MEGIAQSLLPSFASLGYRPTAYIVMDDTLANGRGFPAAPEVFGDSLPGGRIRLRSSLCANDAFATIVVAHEMAHLALNHHGTPGTGVSLAWETPQNELAADDLARKVLQAQGAPKPWIDYLACRLGQCERGPWKNKPVGSEPANNGPAAEQRLFN
ncbi:hypothetical protein DLREEDagrD3_03240 [Denitratisoma sp. agr-D3]